MNASLPNHAVKTTCPYCGVGCGVVVRTERTGSVKIDGDPDHPANFGRLCSKGAALGETIDLDGRLLAPMLRKNSGAYESVSWDTALDHVAEGLSKIKTDFGPDAIAFYLSGQLLTEDYYVANKLIKGFLGSPHVDTNSRLCMASTVAGHKRAFGGDVVPGSYEDLDCADLIVLVGSNTAWCHPVLFQRIITNRDQRGAKIIVIDPRRTPTAEEADLFLPVAAGMDTVLFSYLLQQIYLSDAFDPSFVNQHTNGLAAALEASHIIAPDLATTAALTGIKESDISEFCSMWIGTRKTVTAWSQGVNQSAQGTDKVDAIINCHLASGRIGESGLGPLSLTGQPNAMGGREVGGLANMLAAHMAYTREDIDRVKRFWQAPNLASREGLKAVQMFDAIGAGQIRALWVMATNPAASLPRANTVHAAMSRLDLFVVSEVIRSNDTIAAGPHVLLPAAAWGEKDGTVTNSERRISRQRPFLPLPDEVRPDWWIISEVAKRLGFTSAFDYSNAAAIFREHAALSSFENHGARAFSIAGLSDLSDTDFANLEPLQWPVLSKSHAGTNRLFANGKFLTNDGRANFISPETPKLSDTPTKRRPFLINTGRIRDQWHTMTRTGKSPRLAMHIPDPCLYVNPEDAKAMDLKDGGYVALRSNHATAILRVKFDTAQTPKTAFAPIHWTSETSSNGRIDALVQAATDRYSGQPELKATAASLEPLHFASEGAFVSRRSPQLPADLWWSKVKLGNGHGWNIASNMDVLKISQWFESEFSDCEIADFIDAVGSRYRAVAFKAGKMLGAMFISASGERCQIETLAPFIERDIIEADQRISILSGNGSGSAEPVGPLVCACFGITASAISDAVLQGFCTVADVGYRLKAGTNCGSCKPEIRRLLPTSQAAACST